MKKFITHSEKETFNFAFDLAESLRGGETIGLVGDLGAGKTVFAKGLAKGLGINKNVNSPTFNIMKIYDIPRKNKKTPLRHFCHVDAYRLKDADLVNIGIEDYLGKNYSITLIEWANLVKKVLPENTLTINIKMQNGENERLLVANGSCQFFENKPATQKK